MNDHARQPALRRVPTPLLRVVLILCAGVLLLAACGGDDDVETSSDDSPATSEDDSSTDADADADEDDADEAEGDVEGDVDADGPITVETLAARCDAFTEAITSLRGDAPVWVEPSEAVDSTINGETFREADCHYAYDGDYLDDGDFDLDTEDMDDKNRLSIRVAYADGMTAAQKEQMWDNLATTEPVTGIGDDGQWYYDEAFGIDASARVLTGETVVILSASVPEELASSAWIAKDPMVAALEGVLTIMEG